MGVHLRPLNVRQVEVLRWITAGCPDGVMSDFTYKATAVALQNRRLATVSRKNGVWRAEATDAGRHYLAHGAYPTDARPPVADRWRPDSGSCGVIGRPIAPVADLIREVLAAGGVLVVDRRVDKRDFDRLVAAADRSSLLPPGQQLVMHSGDRWEDGIVRLVDLPSWVQPVADHIPVPAALRSPHPIVAALSQDHSFAITAIARSRALRLLQALIAEALRRGHEVQPSSFEGGRRSGYNSRRSGLDIVVHGHPIRIDIRQQVDRSPHQPTPTELRRAERDSWYRIPASDAAPSSRLSIELGGYEGGQSRWNDTPTHRLEDALPQVMRSIELRAGAAERARVAAEEKAARRRREWETAMTEARAQFRQSCLAASLIAQVDAWTLAQRLGDYLAAMQAEIEGIANPEDVDAAQRWLMWARAYRDRLDPLRATIATKFRPPPRE